MVMVCTALPSGTPCRKQETRACRMQPVDRFKQSRHATGRYDQPVKAPVCRLPASHIRGTVAFGRCGLSLIKNGGSHVRNGVAQSQNLESRAHFSNFADFVQAKICNPDATSRQADGQPLRFQPAKSLTHRDVTGTELFSNMILPQPLTRRQFATNDPVAETACDTRRDCIIRLAGFFRGHAFP